MSDLGTVGMVVRDDKNRCRIRVFSEASNAVTIIVGPDGLSSATATLSAGEAKAVRRALTRAIRQIEAAGGDENG